MEGMVYETPVVNELGSFTQETGFNFVACPEQIGPIEDESCPE